MLSSESNITDALDPLDKFFKSSEFSIPIETLTFPGSLTQRLSSAILTKIFEVENPSARTGTIFCTFPVITFLETPSNTMRAFLSFVMAFKFFLLNLR